MEGRIQSLDIRIEKWGENCTDELVSFSCGCRQLDYFFQHELIMCAFMHFESPYVVRLVSTGQIVGVFTLANDSVVISSKDDLNDFKEDVVQDLKSFDNIVDVRTEFFLRQDSYPAINIGHLGVHVDYQSKGIGTQIFNLIAYTYLNFDSSGCQFITVDAINDSRVNNFYLQMDFEYLTSTDAYLDVRRMYFPLFKFKLLFPEE